LAEEASEMLYSDTQIWQKQNWGEQIGRMQTPDDSGEIKQKIPNEASPSGNLVWLLEKPGGNNGASI
jgi:hypothetical protein